ncbi:MAG: O-acetyl-ADP-ribose deacetylase [Acidobacteria bacterium]|nr:O-acetyl-ADP-ribose deacetylase [Acidobacteriota bacterium]
MEQIAGRDEWRTPEGKLLRLAMGDITRIPVDAIVNAANSALIGGGGVDGAIHRAGGPSIMEELDLIRPRLGGRCPTGSAVATAAGALPARHVFHAVGPVYRDGKHEEPRLLAECYRTCLRLAEERGAQSISFPAISTGVYGYPLREAAGIAVAEVVEHLRRPGTQVREVVIVLFDRRAYEIYLEQLASIE